MGRVPCCEKDNVKRGQWTPEEDNKLASYIAQHGTRNWRLIPKNAGLQRCGKSCRLRWTNYLRPDLKHGEFSDAEEHVIVKLHSVVGNRWSLIAAQLPGRTDNDVKNHWNTKLKKKLTGMGIDPVTHKPFSHLMAEIATTLPPPQVAHLAEAALGCFKDEMLHLLTKKRVDFTGSGSGNVILPVLQLQPACGIADHDTTGGAAGMAYPMEDKDDTIQKIKLGLSRAIMQEPAGYGGEASDGLAAMCDNMYSSMGYGSAQLYGNVVDGEGSAWSQSMCTGSTCTGGAGPGSAEEHCRNVLRDQKGEDEDGEEEAEGGKGGIRSVDVGMFGSDCILWDLSDELMNPIV